MKKIITVALTTFFVLAATVSAQAQRPLVLDKQGAEAEYAIKNAKGAITGYSKTVVTTIDKTDAQNFTVTYSVELFNKNRKSREDPVSYTLSVKNGAVDAVPLLMASIEGIALVEIEGNLPAFPAVPSVGQVIEYSFTMTAVGIKTTTTGKKTVVAKESVTTPAGTFDCYKYEDELASKVMFLTTKSKTVAWIAAGIGNVRVETYNEKNKLEDVQELISLK